MLRRRAVGYSIAHIPDPQPPPPQPNGRGPGSAPQIGSALDDRAPV